jgi:parallel beta-helix repeat protein
MTSRNRLFAVVTLPVCAAILLAGAWFAGAGDLNPPAGPVGPTQRTPVNANMTPGDADSLFKITLPGSYYLTGNITGVAAKHGIEIAASGVTLDLNGFELQGVAGSLDGVSATVASLTNITVVNGSVRSWGDEGIDLWTFSVTTCRVADLLARANAGSGISAREACAFFNCSASQNTNMGINTGDGCTITNCSAYQNTFVGISAGQGCTVSNCSAYINTGTGISVNNGCTVADCTVRGNTLDGIGCSTTCVIRGNTCSSNGNGGDGAGIHATSSDNRIEGNNCTSADRGIDVDFAGNIIIKNTCASNTLDWDIAANNVFGPILDRRAPASAAVSGFTAPDSTGSTHPNANFTY